MAFPTPSLTEITNRIFNNLVNTSGITASLDSSQIGKLTKVIASEVYTIRQDLAAEIQQADLSTATGSSLDGIGIFFTVARNGDQTATSLGSNPAIRFFNNGNTSVVIPPSTRVWTSTNPQIAYLTVEGLSVNAGSNGDVHATAVNVGDSYNVGVGELDTSNVPNSSVTVTNILPLNNGSFAESDASYRERILQKIRSVNITTIDTTVAFLRGVSGVRDVIPFNMKRGPGTVDYIIIPWSSNTIYQVITAALATLTQLVPVGIDVKMYGPNYRYLDVNLALTFVNNPTQDLNQVRGLIQTQIQSYVSNLPLETGNNSGGLSAAKLNAMAVSNANVISASLSIGLDGVPYSPLGQINISIGDQIILRSLTVN